MITIYALEGASLKGHPLPVGAALPAGVVWIDMLEPSREEELHVEGVLGINAPTREEMQEIELSSRIYQENDASYMTATVTIRADTEDPELSPVTFILTRKHLITLRYSEPQAFKTFTLRACRQPGLATSGDVALTGLLDAILDRSADILERLGSELDKLSKEIFAARSKSRAKDLEELLRRLGRNEDLTSKVSESLASVDRLLTFLNQFTSEAKGAKDVKGRIKTLQRDAKSLSEHASFLEHKCSFLLDATLGLINIQQNAIIKIFSVAAVVFLPPTLIASIYGMNFEHMPELGWRFGYLWAVALMIVSAIIPYLYFKRRGWL